MYYFGTSVVQMFSYLSIKSKFPFYLNVVKSFDLDLMENIKL